MLASRHDDQIELDLGVLVRAARGAQDAPVVDPVGGWWARVDIVAAGDERLGVLGCRRSKRLSLNYRRRIGRARVRALQVGFRRAVCGPRPGGSRALGVGAGLGAQLVLRPRRRRSSRLAGRSGRDGLVRRGMTWGAGGACGPLVRVDGGEDCGDGGGCVDGRDDPHPASTVGAPEGPRRIGGPDPHQESAQLMLPGRLGATGTALASAGVGTMAERR